MTDMQPKIARLANETLNTAAANATAFADAGAAHARANLEQGMQHATKAAEGAYKAAGEFNDFTRGTVEVFAQVTQTWMVGTQDLNRHAFAFMQSLTESAIEGARALSGVRSMKEAAEIQATFVRTTMDRVMSESAKMQQASLRLLEQVSAPVTQRMTMAVERATRPLAA